MRKLVGVGVSVGVLAGIWTQVSVEAGLVTWVAFVAWACYFAAGGGRNGLARGLAANLTGALWGWAASLVVTRVTVPGTLAVTVAVLALVLCLQAAWAPLAFIPGAFAGTAVFFGTGFDLGGTLAALAIGGVLGWVSDLGAQRIQALVDRGTAVPAAPAAGPAVDTP